MPCFKVVVALLVSGLALMDANRSHPRGHLMPLGSHTEPYPVEQLDHFPHPEVFYEDYAKTGKPVIFKSSLDKIDFKPLRQWSDDYLRDKFGTTEVRVKTGKKEKKKGKEEDARTMTLAQYLEVYTHTNAYFKKHLKHSMRAEVPLPDCLRCGGFQNLLTSTTITFSSGNIKSRLQLSVYDSIICLLDGRQDIVMYDKLHSFDIENHGFDYDGSYSTVDVNHVDMYKYPKLGRLPWYKAQMKGGGCVYIPAGWFHHVNSSGDRNLAIEISFYHHRWFNQSDCKLDEDWKTNVNLNKYGFTGEREVLRELLLNALMILYFDDAFARTKENFHEVWVMTMVSVKEEESMKVFNEIDENGDGTLSGKEIYSADLLDLYKKYPKAFGNDFRANIRDELNTLANLQLHDHDHDDANAEGYLRKEEL